MAVCVSHALAGERRRETAIVLCTLLAERLEALCQVWHRELLVSLCRSQEALCMLMAAPSQLQDL